jgi:hypothetical protein
VIVIDSNTLHGRANPDTAGSLKPVLALASQVGVKVVIPEGCLIELREGMREKLLEAERSLSDALSKLARLQVPINPPSVDVEAAITAYETRLQVFLREHGIAMIPFPERVPDVRTLFDLAARKQSPFDTTGNSYRDAMIALTVEEYRRTSELPFVVFVTEDARFKRAFSDKVACRNIRETVDVLEARLNAAEKKRRDQLREAIAEALGARLGEITDRASVGVRFSVPLEYGAEIQSIDGFATTEVDAVEPGELTASLVEFTATVKGDLSFTVEVVMAVRAARSRAMATALRRPAKVGESLPPPKPPPQDDEPRVLYYDPGQLRERKKVSVLLSIDGAAVLEGESVTEVRITGVRQVRDPEASSS